ncbi:hypothetical protein ACJX0J_040227 [Zea mays]
MDFFDKALKQEKAIRMPVIPGRGGGGGGGGGGGTNMYHLLFHILNDTFTGNHASSEKRVTHIYITDLWHGHGHGHLHAAASQWLGIKTEVWYPRNMIIEKRQNDRSVETKKTFRQTLLA